MLRPRAESELYFKRLKKKIIIFSSIMLAGFAIISLRLWQLQVVEHTALAHKAENNRLREVTLDGLRGAILDRHGAPLVNNRPSFDLALIPEDIKELDPVLSILSEKFDLDPIEMKTKIRSSKPFLPVTLKRDISRAGVAFVEERRIDLPGVFMQVKPIRNYIYNNIAAHFLGYIGAISPNQYYKAPKNIYSRNDFLGKSGAEKVYEASLRGRKGSKVVEVDAAGRELNLLKLNPPKSGKDIRLTIDLDTQKAAEEAFKGHMGAAIAIDPNNGDILAYVSKPSYNPNEFAFGIKQADWDNLTENEFHPLQDRGAQGQYPPGSVYKLIVAMAALEEGIIDENTTHFCPGHFTLGNRTYRCWKKGGHGNVNVHSAIVQSCDVFFYKTGLQLGIDKIAEYAGRFGLGKPTGIKLGREMKGLIPTRAWKKRAKKEAWITGETVSCSIGQGYVLTTPAQLARMVAAFANGGSLITPKILMNIDSTRKPEKADSKKTLISSKTISIIKNAMRGVVYEPHGTAWRLKSANKGYQYAGKTGTAQVIRMKQNEDWDHEKTRIKFRDHSLFVAFAPFDDPKIAVAIIGEHAGHGGEVAAPIAHVIMDTYIAGLMKRDAAKITEATSQVENGY